MKQCTVLYRNGGHCWLVAARDPQRQDHVIDTNEYLISSDGMSLLTDPGGMEVFPAVFSALGEAADLGSLRAIFASHQDPDVISSLSLWLEFEPSIRCYTSWLWTSFIPHFGGQRNTFVPIPDEGMEIPLGRITLQALPAHYLHSPGNFHLYDPAARILFTGDLGAALLSPGEEGLFVTDFDRHIRHAEGFHRRWIGSKEAVREWCERVSGLSIDMLCPQHGAIYTGADVMRFINWLSELDVGGGLRRASPSSRAA